MIDQSRAESEMDATGVVYILPECAEGKFCPHAHLWVYCILYGVGIHILFVHWSGCGRPQIAGQADEDTPLFVCFETNNENPLTLGYQSEQRTAVYASGSNQRKYD